MAQLPCFKGKTRGYKKHSFTYADIAEAVGLAPKTVRNHVSAGLFDPGDLRSLAAYVVERAVPRTPLGTNVPRNPVDALTPELLAELDRRLEGK